MADRYVQNLLGENEEILRVTRQHWVVLLQTIGIELLILAGILALATVALTLTKAAAIAWGYVLVLLPLASLLRDTLIWSHHQYIVTSRRVIQITGVLNKAVTDSSLEKVNDVKMEQSWLGRLLNYGDIEILTASELGVNRFTQIKAPVAFKTAMLNAKSKLSEDQPRLAAQLDALHKAGVLTDAEWEAKKKLLAGG
jgi:uncharacterized membrane protein YdbT with pleckstrin-like domain